MSDIHSTGSPLSVSAIADENAIRTLSHAFSDAVNRRDYELFRSIWTDDAVWIIGDPLPSTASGRENIVTHVKDLLQVWTFFVQQLHSGVVHLDGDSARASWTVQETGRSADDTKFYNNFAIYEDDLVKQDGVWRFRKRTYHYVWVDIQTPIPGQAFPPPSFTL